MCPVGIGGLIGGLPLTAPSGISLEAVSKGEGGGEMSVRWRLLNLRGGCGLRNRDKFPRAA